MQLTPEMIAQLQSAMKSFGDQKDFVQGLQEKIVALEAQVTSLSQRAPVEADPHLGVWNSEQQAKHFVDFIRELTIGDVANVRVMSEGTDADGGYLVPQEFKPQLIRLIDQYGLIRQNATIIPMQREELALPTLASGVTVYWKNENAALTATQPTFGQLTLTLNKLTGLIPSSSELIQDSTIEIANLIATLVGEAFAKEEDRVGFVGDTGSGDPFMGILNDTGVTAVTMAATNTDFTDMDADDLMDLIAGVSTSASEGARFVMHRTVFDIVRKLKGTDGHYIYQAPAAGQPGTIWGYPYLLSDSMPAASASAADTPFVIFGNLKHLYLADRMAMSIAVSPHVGFANDQMYWRFIERIGLKVAIGAAFAVLKTAAA